MSLALCYWICMLLMLCFGAWSSWPNPSVRGSGGNVLLFILLLILGWHAFGAPLHG